MGKNIMAGSSSYCDLLIIIDIVHKLSLHVIFRAIPLRFALKLNDYCCNNLSVLSTMSVLTLPLITTQMS